MDPLGSLELFAEIEGKVTKPVLGPICAGGLFRLEFIAGYDPSERQPGKLEIKFAVAVVISVGGNLIPELVKVEGQVHYGYMLVLDYANGKVYQAFLKFDGFGLRVSHECFFVYILFSTFHWWLTERFSSMTNEQ